MLKVLITIYMVLLCFLLKAQQQNISVAEQQREKIIQIVNQSNNIEIPIKIKKEFYHFYEQQNKDVKIADKLSIILKGACNNTIPYTDRVFYIQYFLEKYKENPDEFPLYLLTQIKDSITVKKEIK